jgi:pimeloyl-ACP methyl ester carboxylesterase
MDRGSACPVKVRLAALVLLALFFAGCGGHGAVKTRRVPGRPGLQYEVDGNFLYLLCTGHGSPTVILETGLGGDHTSWSMVQPVLARTTRVCSYDRAGLGLSWLAPKRKSAREKAGDLHALLRAADINGPLVLVGWSYGGMLVHLYASAYPNDVVGLVLVDSSHPDFTRRIRAVLPPPVKDELPLIHDLRQEQAPNPEGVDWRLSDNETRTAGPLGARPLIVVTAGQPPPELALLPKLARRVHRVWLSLQDDLARLSSDSLHVIAVRSPHMVAAPWGQPGLVNRAIRAVVEAARTRHRLPRCHDLFQAPAAKCVGG